MILDSRTSKVLLYIIKNRRSRVTSIYQQFSVSESQLRYTIAKGNDFLASYQLGVIKIDKKCIEVISPHEEQLCGLISLIVTYVPSEAERQQLLILMVATLVEELSLLSLALQLQVSKNTVLKDLKETNKLLEKKGIRIKYSRKKGYLLTGDEWQIRSLLFEALDRIMDERSMSQVLRYYLDVKDEEVIAAKDKIKKIEAALRVRYIERQSHVLAFFLITLLRRINSQNQLDRYSLIKLTALADTIEYRIVTTVIDKNELFSENDRLYFTLQFLALGKARPSPPPSQKEALTTALNAFLLSFESTAVYLLPKKEQLLQKLSRHFEPAYYRIMYGLTLKTVSVDNLPLKYKTLNQYVKNALLPLEKLVGRTIPEHEVIYLTIFLATHLIECQHAIKLQKQAVVVCTSGESIAQLLRIRLIAFFPEFSFLKAMSKRTFYDNAPVVDLIFSVIPLQINQPYYFIETIPSDEALNQLRSTVLQDGFEKKAALDHKFVSNCSIHPYQKLLALLPRKHVQHTSYASWREAMIQAATPLLKGNIIKPRYLEAMLQRYPRMHVSIFLRETIALPHESSHHGVNGVGFSLLFIKEGIKTELGLVHCLVLIVSDDAFKQLEPLKCLVELAENKTLLKACANENSAGKAYQRLLNEI
ncbi:BglG family transcription antiterminator [Brochothrix campestris]